MLFSVLLIDELNWSCNINQYFPSLVPRYLARVKGITIRFEAHNQRRDLEEAYPEADY